MNWEPVLFYYVITPFPVRNTDGAVSVPLPNDV